MSKPAGIQAINYQLGETIKSFADIPNFERMTKALDLPNMPSMWGWGKFSECHDVERLVTNNIKELITNNAVNKDEIDLVIFCGAFIDSLEEDKSRILSKVINDCELRNASFFGVNIGGCASLLKAVALAEKLSSFDEKKILVVSVDIVPKEVDRLVDYAIYSDASVALLIDNSNENQFKILGSDEYFDHSLLQGDCPADENARLDKENIEGLLKKTNLRESDVSKLFSPNIYLPIKKFRDSSVGFTPNQQYNENVRDKAHCLSSDSFINLVDYLSQTKITQDEIYVLSSSADGQRASLALKCKVDA